MDYHKHFWLTALIFVITLTGCNTASINTPEDSINGGRSTTPNNSLHAVSFKGTITDFISQANFKIKESLIDASQATLEPSTLRLGNNLEVVIEGAVVDGKIRATQVAQVQAPSVPEESTPPAAFINASQIQGIAPMPVSFDGSSSTAEGGVVAYLWNFGDGSQASGATVSHSYTRPGRYIASLTATDAAGLEGTTSITIDVTAAETGSRSRGSDSSGNSGMRVGDNFGFLANDQAENSPFVNNVNFAAAWNSGKTGLLVNTNVWKPEFLSDISNYSALRFLNWTATNGNHVRNWSNVLSPTDSQNNNIHGFTPKPGGQYRVMAYEWQIDLCNRVGADMWITVPAHTDASTDDYWGKLARLIRDNLDPSLNVYVEYSNEIWNFAFEQRDYVNDRAKAMGVSGDDNTRVWKYTVKASVDLWQVFVNEFGGRDRLQLVLPGQSANSNMAEYHYRDLKDSSLNPNGLRPDVYAIAPYVGHVIDSGSGDVFGQLQTELETVTRPQLEAHRELADANNVELVTYEGGQHIYLGGRVASVNRDPRMYAFYKDYLTMLSEYVPLTMNFMYSGRYSDQHGNAWGSKESITQPIDQAHKYRAIQDWISERSP
jgi:hypothetical protein